MEVALCFKFVSEWIIAAAGGSGLMQILPGKLVRVNAAIQKDICTGKI